jgi:hypothetical protein
MYQPAMNVPRQGAADAHGKEIAADDSGELKDAIADQVTGQRPRHKFVNQAARGDQENRDEKN